MKCPTCKLDTDVTHWGGMCADCANEAGREYEDFLDSIHKPMDESYDRWVDQQMTERGK